MQSQVNSATANPRTVAVVGLVALLLLVSLFELSNPASIKADQGEASLTAVQLTAGHRHACALTDENQVVCWGLNNVGQIDVPDGQYQSVSAGVWHTCAVTTNGEVRCWGANAWGQTDVPAERFSSVVAGTDHSCAIREADGGVVCWGRDGQLLRTPDGSFRSIDTRQGHACGLRSDGQIRCWGSNHYGESEWPEGRYLDVGVTALATCALSERGVVECWGRQVIEPKIQPGSYRSISAGEYHVCGITTEQGTNCWGLHSWSENRAGESQAPAIEYAAVEAGTDFSCGLTASGKVRCWGAHSYGHEVPQAGPFQAIAAGGFFTCGLTDEGELRCWGGNEGQWTHSEHEQAWKSEKFLFVDAGADHVCAITEAQRARCWVAKPHHVRGITSPVPGRYLSLALSDDATCGLTTGGEVRCWSKFQILDEFSASGWTSVTTGFRSVCGLRMDGQIVCAGDEHKGTPPSGVYAAVSVGDPFGCALDEDQGLTCWANSAYAELYGWADAPLGRYIAIDAGPRASCALSVDGEVVCHALADGSNAVVSCEEISGATGWRCEYARGNWTTGPSPPYVSVSTGRDHACALRQDGEADCWILYDKPTDVPEPLRTADGEPQVNLAEEAAVEEAEAMSPISLGRIAARRLDDGGIEFAFDPVDGERVLPASRFVPADATVGRWLDSSPVVIDGVEWGRISAQRRPGGEVELSFVSPDGERIRPRSRIFPPGATFNHWLRTSEFDALVD